MEKERWHPGKLLETSGYYWRTCTLHAGVKLDLFTVLGGDCLDAAALAGALGTDPEATLRLLNALAAMGLLDKSGEGFRNTEESSAFLSKGSPGYVGHMIMHHHHLLASWGRLDEAVRAGGPVRARATLDDPARREAFLMGMFNNAMLQAPRLVESVDLSGRTRLLDMGGGPGTYAIHFCRRNPGLSATVFDLPATRPFAEKTIARFDMRDRIGFMAGDYVADEIEGNFDVVWMSHILHGEGPDVCRRMIAKAAAVLEPGGLILVHEFILEDTLDAPLFPALFSLNMLLGTASGRAYSEGQIVGMLQDAGVGEIRRHPFVGPTQSGIVTGVV